MFKSEQKIHIRGYREIEFLSHKYCMDCQQYIDNYIKASKECASLSEHCNLERAGRTRSRLTYSSYGTCKDVPSNCYYDLQKHERAYKKCLNK